MRTHGRFLLLPLPLALACSSVPYTGRSQFNLLSRDEERSLGLQAFQEVRTKERVVGWGADFDLVQRVKERIAAAAKEDAPDFQWEVILIESNQVNAWCLPGGKMGVYTGILPVTKTEAGLAVVMGHEVAHAIARHGGERMSQGMAKDAALTVAEVGLGKSDPGTREVLLKVFGIASEVGFVLPFSREHESEADQIGLILMAKAGYDPREAPEFWKRMAALGGSRGPSWLSTHPSHDTRIQDIEGWLPDAIQRYEASKKPSSAAPAPPAPSLPGAAPAPKPAGKVEPPPLPGSKPKIPSGGGA